MKKKIFTVLLTMILVLGGLGFGQAIKVAEAKESADDTFTFSIDSGPVSLNPISANDRWGMTAVNLVFSPLARSESDGAIKNELANEIVKADDGLSVTVTLKENLVWSDGQPLTADDVVFTYEKKIDKNNGASDMLWVGEQPVTVEKIDDLTIKFTLPALNVPILNQVAVDTYILPKHVYENVDFAEAEVNVDPVGSGPYKFAEYKKGEYLKFEANESYYGGQANLNNVVLQIISNPDTAKVALQSGEVDAGLVQPAEVKEMQKNDLKIRSYSENRVGYMGINMNSKKVADEKVRQAMFLALNKPEMNKATYLNKKYYSNAYSILPPNNEYYNNKVKKYKTNVKKATDLIKEADAEGTQLNLGYMTGDKIQKMQVTFIKEALEEIGLKVKLSAVETAALVTELQKENSKKYDMYISGYIWGNDPGAYKSQFKSDGDFNIMHYKNDKVDELFNAGANELDEVKRKDIYNQLQTEIANDAVFYPIVDNKKIIASNPSVKGFSDAKFVPVYIMEDWSKLSK